MFKRLDSTTLRLISLMFICIYNQELQKSVPIGWINGRLEKKVRLFWPFQQTNSNRHTLAFLFFFNQYFLFMRAQNGSTWAMCYGCAYTSRHDQLRHVQVCMLQVEGWWCFKTNFIGHIDTCRDKKALNLINFWVAANANRKHGCLLLQNVVPNYGVKWKCSLCSVTATIK